MSSFDNYTNYKEASGVSSVVFGSDKPVLEVEMNEVQEIQKSRLNKTIKRLFGDGISDTSKISFDGSKVSVASGCALVVDGYVVECTGLSLAMTSGTAYVQVWEETEDYSATLKKEGNQQSSETVNNYFKDSRFPQETSQRKVVKYTLASSVDESKHNLAIASVSGGSLTVMCKEVNVAKLRERISNLESKVADLNNQVIDLRAQAGTIGEGVMGLHVDLENNIFERVGDNENWTAGSDYDQSPVYGGRYRCNVTDDGVIVAKYGDEAYTETGALTVKVVGTDDNVYPIGTKVQCMVFQPLFYYKRIPLRVKKQVDANYTVKGYHLLEFIDLISPVMREGFKVHPAFKKGETVLDGYFIGENDGSLESADGEYDMDDNTVSIGTSPYTGIKFSSIAGAKPASGAQNTDYSKANKLTKDAIRKLCANRGEDWQEIDLTIVSAEQMLFVIEYATFNIQNTPIDIGIVNVPFIVDINNAVPCPINTILGNGSGSINTTFTHSNGKEYSVKVPVYRGVKNHYGNIWKIIDGIMRNTSTNCASECFYQDGSKPFSDVIADHISCGFSFTTTNGFAKAFGYSKSCDWCYITSLTGGDELRPIGDYSFVDMQHEFSIVCLGSRSDGGRWSGMFYWTSNYVTGTYGSLSGRLCRKSATIKVAC